VACPFFFPIERLDDGAWLKPPRLPLGDPCRGECRAITGARVQPSRDELKDFCNTGYARGRCARFPRDTEPDAIRFSMAKDRGGSVDLVYVIEKEYSPLSYGPMKYDCAAASFVESPEDPILRAQAQQFVHSYLNRRTTR
jgi:hypothetical protein